MLLADANLTGIRYGMLRRAFAEVRARVCAQAAAILRPVLERISAALEAEHARRLELAAPLKWDKKNEPGVVVAQRAVDAAFSWSCNIGSAAKTGNQSPLQMADVLMYPELLPVWTPPVGL